MSRQSRPGPERQPYRVTVRALATAERVLRDTLETGRPVDAVLAHVLRDRRALGGAERRLVGEAVFGALRRRRTLGELAASSSERALILAAVVRHPEIGPAELESILDPVGLERAREIASAAAPDFPPALAADLPDWLYERLCEAVGEGEAAAAAAALARPAPLDLRVNPLRLSREQALARLIGGGFRAEACPHAPLGIRVRGRPTLRTHALYQGGDVEIQDEGSQLVALAVGARPREMIADYCAGAGGKTLALGAAMRSSGRLYAFDVDARRLERLRPRLSRSGLSNVVPVPITGASDTRVKRLRGKLDRVLVDAPCTGLGTVRRNPDLKWKVEPSAVAEMAAKQLDILASAARLVRPGGRLVYATCSWLPEENEQVIAAFLEASPEFAPRSVSDDLAAEGVVPPERGETFQLWPHRHATDGFFIASLERRVRAATGGRPISHNG